MKYFVLGALASGLLLYGMSMIYGATGTLRDRARSRKAPPASLQADQPSRRCCAFGLVFVVSGLAFKVGVVPFHMWIPDVYHGAPSSVTLFISTGPKLAAFAMAMRLLVERAAGAGRRLAADARDPVGAVDGDRQPRRDRADQHQAHARLLDHLAHGLHAARPALGDRRRQHAVGGRRRGARRCSTRVVYVLMSLGAFGMVVLLSRAGFEAERIEDFKGLNARSPWFAFIMLLLMFSLAGRSADRGFLRQARGAAGGARRRGRCGSRWSRCCSRWSARSTTSASSSSCTSTSPSKRASIETKLDAGILLSANGLAMLALGILPQPLMQLCLQAIEGLLSWACA